jgi:Uncharacterized protein conserved in archaea
MIDIRQNGILRLHAADDVAVTVYCGRPNYQTPSGRSSADELTASSSFLFDPLTPIRNAAASASAAFANTVADVKFNLDGLTCQQAIEFMKQVKNATDKRNDQLLSSQFNLNRVLVDDRPDTVARRGAPLEVSDPLAIAQLTLELTVAGGWERVTLDSSSKKIPSTPLLDLINLRALSQWVHEAHSKGLETYISGGMNDQHVRLATMAGVDGVGIGFWCHRCNEASGALGEPDPFKIKLCLEARNESEASQRGIAARVVARLDKAFCGAQGNLDAPAEGLRQNLFEVLHSEKDHKLDPLINEATRLGFLP